MEQPCISFKAVTEILWPEKPTIFIIMEKEMATHSSILAWKIPWTEEPGRLTVHGITKSQIGLNKKNK